MILKSFITVSIIASLLRLTYGLSCNICEDWAAGCHRIVQRSSFDTCITTTGTCTIGSVTGSYTVLSAGTLSVCNDTEIWTEDIPAFPWYPSELLDSTFVTNLHQWGLNVVRLGIMWAGVEPQRQQYNVTYLNIMKQIVELLESNNIYVVLDMHQDVLSSRFGTYDGIPLWLYDRFPPPNHAYPFPLSSTPSDNNWALGYVTEACSHGFQCLYDNVDGAVDSMSDFWRLIATTFGHYPNVLGYELINEPWIGNYFVKPTLLFPGISGSKNLLPFYDKLAKAIRTVDIKTLIFYEPITYSERLSGQIFGSGFSHVPGGIDYQNRSVLSYHYYCTTLAINLVPGNENIPIFDRVLCNNIEGPAVFRSVKNEIRRLGGSGFLTEFGGCDGSSACDNQLEVGATIQISLELSPRFFRYGYGTPLYHAINGGRHLLFGSYSRFGINVGVFVIYLGVMIIFTVLTYYLLDQKAST
ncbi:unnamed protein product [Rotaria sordida]|nr:unnamed protein product [Rotaria sordida]